VILSLTKSFAWLAASEILPPYSCAKALAVPVADPDWLPDCEVPGKSVEVVFCDMLSSPYM